MSSRGSLWLFLWRRLASRPLLSASGFVVLFFLWRRSKLGRGKGGTTTPPERGTAARGTANASVERGTANALVERGTANASVALSLLKNADSASTSASTPASSVASSATSAASSVSSPAPRAPCQPGRALSAGRFRSFPILSITEVSPDSQVYRFELPHPAAVTGLPVGRHLTVRAVVGGETVLRPYTPSSPVTQTGWFELLVKTYEMGKMSRRFQQLRVGDTLDMKGPIGNFRYGVNKYEALVMLAAGSGLTPMLQIVLAALQNDISDISGKDTTTTTTATTATTTSTTKDRTRLVLLFQNRHEHDILLREQLEQLAADHPDQFTLVLLLSAAPLGWEEKAALPRGEGRGGCVGRIAGYITANVLREKGVTGAGMPPPSADGEFKVSLGGGVGGGKAVQ
jgi:ferredoxin-NADP reductase